MIERIITINNIGVFDSLKTQPNANWDGNFKQTNLIYAGNSLGKTTLATIFKAFSNNDNSILKFKKTQSDNPQKVRLRFSEPSKDIDFTDNQWNELTNTPKVLVFDSHFVEDYLFRSSFSTHATRVKLIELILGGKGIRYHNRFREVAKIRQGLNDNLKKGTMSLDSIEYKEAFRAYDIKLNNLSQEFHSYADQLLEEFKTSVNLYLQSFNPNLELLRLSYSENNKRTEYFLELIFSLSGKEIRFENPIETGSTLFAKYSLSEGDKNAIALSCFMAYLKQNDYSEKIVVIDDPFTSFDSDRRNYTMIYLSEISHYSKQFFLLSHDKHFINDFMGLVGTKNTTSLKIERERNRSVLKHMYMEDLMYTIAQRNYVKVSTFLNSPSNDEQSLIDASRCVRPMLEGLIKFKFFDEISGSKSLGQIIQTIEYSTENQRIYRLKSKIHTLKALNQFSLKFHHSKDQNDPVSSITESVRMLRQGIDLFDNL